ncbi:SAM-dependent methyltransferase [Amycolatopsis sp. NPDC005961]|uniref:SAM-dependent methyltransferase n=1 Tax=Amycolatopsis sp. NPDC005961 TaxID=3156720 RepID=UPI0033F3D1BB
MTLAPPPGLFTARTWRLPVASPARIHNAALGGTDNYVLDREALAALEETAPGFTELLRATRAWHVRVVRHLAHRGIDQFLDLAAGLPHAHENTHQIAQRHNRDATVAYTDTDPLLLSYGRALLEDNDATHIVSGDHLDPHRLLDHEQLWSVLDLRRPVAVLMTRGVQHELDDHRLSAALTGYRSLLAPGSALALSGWIEPVDDPDLARSVEQVWHIHSGRRLRCRTGSELRRLFDGYDLLDPGLAPVQSWWPDGPLLRAPGKALKLGCGGVGVVPPTPG